MISGPPPLRDRLQRLRDRIDAAAARAERRPEAVRLVAVVKTVPAEAVAEALALGVHDLGESRVQEAQARVARFGRDAARWHMVGHLQRNKAGHAVELFDRIHSVDNLSLAEALSRRAEAAGRRVPVMVEINIAAEPTKHGVSPEDAAELVEGVARLPGLALDGLMTVAPRAARPDEARPHFARMRALRDGLAATTGIALPELSMGMSDDFEEAIAEGSTMVRVGTALFGARG